MIPLLTLEESTSSATNSQQSNNQVPSQDQSMLNSVIDSLTAANEELKAKDAIIENLKKRIKRQEAITKKIYGISNDYYPKHDGIHISGGNCGHKVCVRFRAETEIRLNNNNNSGLSDLVNSLEDDELEFNLSIS